jgi:hydrogenase maturation protein HypF
MMSMGASRAEGEGIARLKITVRGAVQGVGFRPHVFRLAKDLALHGWVSNSAQGVFLEAEGPAPALRAFLLRLESEKPPRSFIQSLESSWLDPVGYGEFEIRESERGGPRTALVMPDVATCPDCLREILDPADRRYLYPFTNCTNCGPRFSIIEQLPYDRAGTSMKVFPMCPACQAEFDDPRDRRFHAQPNACAACGPSLQLWDPDGQTAAPAHRAEPGTTGATRAVLGAAAKAVRAGRILAVKGLGGFHLIVAAHDEEAVRRLRERKHREEKPLALMFPSLDLVARCCEVSPMEDRLLRSPEAPIVLLRRNRSQSDAPGGKGLAPSVAPRNPNLGVMLPYTPLHHLLLSMLEFPVVATSGNLSDEPISIDEREALERLGGIADLFLVHNRAIVRHVDDSIVRVIAGREMVLRRARGYAPLPVQLSGPEPQGSVLAVGAHLKNAVALSVGRQVFVSQHIGDLETEPAYAAFRRVTGDLQRLFDTSPAIIATDAHPDYLSTKFARELCAPGGIDSRGGKPAPACLPVQHHVAHVFSCLAENELSPPVLGVSWDGTGYGPDGTIWGGEFFLMTGAGVERLAGFRPFPLPGGDVAIKEPRRTALGLLFELRGENAFGRGDLASLRAFPVAELAPLRTMLTRRLNSPMTSSVGRLFDAVASLIGLRQRTRFEGQAAMELEFALEPVATDEAYPVLLHAQAGAVWPAASHLLDWAPLAEAVLRDCQAGVPASMVSARFHNGLVEAIVAVARVAALERVLLTGGCFQNRYLAERAIQRLSAEGFRPYWHQRVPPNDGGIALGQVAAALFLPGSPGAWPQ